MPTLCSRVNDPHLGMIWESGEPLRRQVLGSIPDRGGRVWLLEILDASFLEKLQVAPKDLVHTRLLLGMLPGLLAQWDGTWQGSVGSYPSRRCHTFKVFFSLLCHCVK